MPKNYTCDICGAVTTGRLALWAHKNDHGQAQREALMAKKEELEAQRKAADAELRKAAGVPEKKENFSEASKDGSCPKCGGTSFKAKRPIGRTVGWAVVAGPAALAVRRSQVRCVTCGTIYLRK